MQWVKRKKNAMKRKENAMTENNERIPDNLYCPILLEVLPTEQFRALNCGHCFSLEFFELRPEPKLCPACRQPDYRGLDELPMLQDYQGKLYYEREPEGSLPPVSVHVLIAAQLIRRAKTIRVFVEAAHEINITEKTGTGVKIGGSVAGVVGSGMALAGTIVSLTGIGAVVGIPMAIAGAVVGGAGGLVFGGGAIGELISRNNTLKRANAQFQQDYFHAMQLQMFITRAARDQEFAAAHLISINDALGMMGVFARVAKIGVVTAGAIRVALGVTKAGLHVAGLVMSAVLLPIDLYQMIVNSVKIHKGERSEVVKELDNYASTFLDQLILVLQERNYHVKVHDVDSRQLLVALREEEDELNVDVAYEEIVEQYVVLVDVVKDESRVRNLETQQVLDLWSDNMNAEL